MKILYLITRAERGGAQVHVLDLLRGFRPYLDMEVAAGEDGFLLDEARALGLRCHVVPGLVQPLSPLQDCRALGGVVRLIRRVRPDLVHVHTSKAGVLGRLAGRVCGVPTVFTAHTWCFAEGTSLLWKLLGTPLERLSGLLSERIITVSEANRQLALRRRIAPAERLVTIHNGVSGEDGPAGHLERAQPDPPVLMMVARFSRQKDQALLLEALSAVEQPWRLQFVGDGPTRGHIEQLVREKGLCARVEFLGDRSNVAGLLQQASIFVLPSHWEGFPLSILEAMRAGLPTLATDVGGVAEALRTGETGFLIARGDVDSWRRRLGELLRSPELRRRMGRAGRRRFNEHFRVDRMLEQTRALYGQIALRPAALRERQLEQELEHQPELLGERVE